MTIQDQISTWQEIFSCARKVYILLSDEPIRPGDSSLLSVIVPELSKINLRLVVIINEAEFAFYQDSKGRREKVGEELAGFASYLQLICCLYHGLSYLEEDIFTNALRNFASLRLAAEKLTGSVADRYF